MAKAWPYGGGLGTGKGSPSRRRMVAPAMRPNIHNLECMAPFLLAERDRSRGAPAHGLTFFAGSGGGADLVGTPAGAAVGLGQAERLGLQRPGAVGGASHQGEGRPGREGGAALPAQPHLG